MSDIKDLINETVEAMTKQASELSYEDQLFAEAVREELVKLAGCNYSDEEVNAMITLERAGMEKSANVAGAAKGMLGIAKETAARSVGSGVAGLGLGLGALAALKASKKIGDIREYGKYRSALKDAYSGNEMLEELPEENIRNVGDTIYRFAPTASQDPNLLRNILNSYAMNGGQGGMEPQTVKMLTEIEDRLNRRNQLSLSNLSL